METSCRTKVFEEIMNIKGRARQSVGRENDIGLYAGGINREW